MGTHVNDCGVKEKNRGFILRLLATGVCHTRIDLAKCSKLSKMSITNIVNGFIEKGWIEEAETQEYKNVGRKPVCLKIAEQAPKMIGILIKRNVCIAVLCDLQMKVLEECSSPLNAEKSSHMVEDVIALIEKLIKRYPDVLGIGISSVGPIDTERGIILNPPNFYGIVDIPIVEIIKKRFELPVYLDNISNGAAQAELFYGIGKAFNDFIFVGIADGIGSGFVLNGQLHYGNYGLVSELGHISIDYNGKKCNCGNRGCLELYVNTRTIVQTCEEKTGKHMRFQEICEQIEDLGVSKIFDKMVEQLACAFVTAVNLFHPKAFILGDEGVYLPEKYRHRLEEKVNNCQLTRGYHQVLVKTTVLGEKAPIIGCTGKLLEQVFQGKIT